MSGARTRRRAVGGTIETQEGTGAIRTVAFIGNHPPRRCGIATFTADLATAVARESPGARCFTVAMNDAGKHHLYPERVRFEIVESELGSYRRAADFLNVSDVDVVSLQHEYGIFGGRAGSHVLALLRELRMPIVTTLHTILPEPNQAQRAALNEILDHSQRVVVMSEHGARLLTDVHGVPVDKIEHIPHGITVPAVARSSKRHLGVEGRTLLLTFGLLSADKGIEYVIDALPEIVAKRPDVLYVVLGATHPHVKDREGETYRLALENRAQRLGVDSHIVFHDRFVSQDELAEFISAADVYVTPYLSTQQITSGTLAYAVGAGKPTISTGFPHARELLAEGRGIIVPWRDAAAIAREVLAVLEDSEKRATMSERAAAYGRTMTWEVVGRRYMETFELACAQQAERRRSLFQARTLAKRPALPELNLRHMDAMTDSTGILQHAIFCIPRYEDGYCLDDNARGLVLCALVEETGVDDPQSLLDLASRYMAFVRYAFNDATGRFRNFMSYSRRWTEDCGSEDSHGRAIWALGAVVGNARDPSKRNLCNDLFHTALPAMRSFKSPRAWAFGLLGIADYLRAFDGDRNVEAMREHLATRLLELYRASNGRGWHWFENKVTYDNARLCEALILSGRALKDEEMTQAGLQSLAWLASVQRSDAGHFSPIGTNGFLERGSEKALFDQQPLEACAMVWACAAAYQATGEARWMQEGKRAFAWFLGQNHLQLPLYDPSTGGCRDGLHADRANENQGAESTIAFQLALAKIRGLETLPAMRLVPRGHA